MTKIEKQKAKEIYDKFYFATDHQGYHSTSKYRAKIQAIICVNEIIKALKTTTGHCTLSLLDRQEIQSDFDYWERVRAEIQAI